MLVYYFILCSIAVVFSNQISSSHKISQLRRIVANCLSASIVLSNYNIQTSHFPLYSPLSIDSYSKSSAVHANENTIPIDAEAINIIRQARQVETNGDLAVAQKLYEQIVISYPDYSVAWSDLGNVLTTRGNLDQALLCYRKALSLKPPPETLSVIYVNKAAIEQALGKNDDALKDLNIAEKLSAGNGKQTSIITNKAVVLTNQGKWNEACQLFEQVINTSEKNALPWWLRYSMALLETGRGTESLAFLQRTLNRFPDETECKAYAAALYTALGTPVEAVSYWNKIPEIERQEYMKQTFSSSSSSSSSSSLFVQDQLHWGPVAVKSYQQFLKYLATNSD